MFFLQVLFLRLNDTKCVSLHFISKKKMDRATADKINNDSQIVKLRLQIEDLINGIDSLSEEEFTAETQKIEAEISRRFAELYAEYK